MEKIVFRNKFFILTGLVFKINVVPLHRIINNNLKMARPIKNTPALYGKDAKRFLSEISVLPSVEERKRERLRIKRSVNEFMSLVAQRQGKA